MSNPDTTDINNLINERTIADFGEQFSHYQCDAGYYGSSQCLLDILGPFSDEIEISGKSTADIGSGTGRIVKMLLDLGAESVLAIEPSSSFQYLEQNFAGDRLHLLQERGEAIAQFPEQFDLVFSIGVLHHITDPDPVVKAAQESLKKGGKLVIWLYGREGNLPYLMLASILRSFTTSLSHQSLVTTARLLRPVLDSYAGLCSGGREWLPMHTYMKNHIQRLSDVQREMTIYDQLNPAWAKYYSRQEAIGLLERNGFATVRAYHRHKYSWTVIGEKR